MGCGSAARRLAGWAAAGLVCVAAGWAGAAHAALSDTLCDPRASAALQAYPSAAELQKDAAGAEAELLRRGPSGQFQDLMPALDPPTTGAQRPSAQAMAQYCVAVGELMRVSPQGSQLSPVRKPALPASTGAPSS